MSSCPRCGARYFDARLRACPVDGVALVSGEPPPPSSSPEQSLRAGEMVGEYQIEAPIGAGGFGVVYRAVQPLIGKRVAVKVLARHYAPGDEMVERFVTEARAVNRIRHRNIIDIFSFGVLPDGRNYYVMELLEGETLADLLDRVGTLSPELAIDLLRPVARALDAAHAAGIAHRDLKPENIFLAIDRDEEVYPKLLDFGIAKLFNGAAPRAGTTGTGAPIGTPHYMSPEQCRGRDVDQRTDVYAFGVLTFRAFTGRLPFEGDDVMSVMMAQVSVPPPRPSSLCSSLPTSIDAPLLQMLAKDPAARPASVLQAVDALAAACGVAFTNPASLPPPSLTSTPMPPPSIAPPSFSPASVTMGAPPFATVAASTDPSGSSGIAMLNLSASGVRPSPPAANVGARRVSLALGAVLVVAIGSGGFWLGRQGGPASATTPLVATGVPERLGAHDGAAVGPGSAGREVVPGPAGAEVGSGPAGAEVGPGPAGREAGTSVRVLVRSTPAAEVYRGERRLGSSGEAFEVPRGEQAFKLTLRAEGYRPFELEVKPSADREMAVTLVKKTSTASPVAPASGAASGGSLPKARLRVSSDLENPFD
ncbi:MAG: protein kinase [Polyangiaceae bacterium]|nr:protein kinase [Polyangiaceae bacterium]